MFFVSSCFFWGYLHPTVLCISVLKMNVRWVSRVCSSSILYFLNIGGLWSVVDVVDVSFCFYMIW